MPQPISSTVPPGGMQEASTASDMAPETERNVSPETQKLSSKASRLNSQDAKRQTRSTGWGPSPHAPTLTSRYARLMAMDLRFALGRTMAGTSGLTSMRGDVPIYAASRSQMATRTGATCTVAAENR
jgi:hypothetical protein